MKLREKSQFRKLTPPCYHGPESTFGHCNEAGILKLEALVDCMIIDFSQPPIHYIKMGWQNVNGEETLYVARIA